MYTFPDLENVFSVKIRDEILINFQISLVELIR